MSCRPIYNLKNVDWVMLSMNENAIHILELYPEKIHPYAFLYNDSIGKMPNILDIIDVENFTDHEWDVISSQGNETGIKLLEKYPDKIDWDYLSYNPSAIHLLEKNTYKINWNNLSFNSAAVSLLNNNSSEINFENVCSNPHAMEIIGKYFIPELVIDEQKDIDLFDFYELSKNPSAVKIFENHPDLIDWEGLSENPNAIHILERHPENINWINLGKNKNAISILEKNLNKINWLQIAMQPELSKLFEKCNIDEFDEDSTFWLNLPKNHNLIHIIEKKINVMIKINNRFVPESKACFESLCENPNAIHIIEQHKDRICYKYLSSNPNAIHLVAPLNHDEMRRANKNFKREIAEKVFEPKRMTRLSKLNNMDLLEYMELY
jgi:hypothetical protein